jgi:predicted DNA-binding transcriptional regulator AlpA
MHDDRVYLPAPKVALRYSVTDMTIWRWLHDPALGFPQPIRINRKRFWNISDLEQWERTRATRRVEAVA